MAMAKQMGRPRQWAEDMQARFPAGTFKRIAAVLGEDEDRTDFCKKAPHLNLDAQRLGDFVLMLQRAFEQGRSFSSFGPKKRRTPKRLTNARSVRGSWAHKTIIDPPTIDHRERLWVRRSEIAHQIAGAFNARGISTPRGGQWYAKSVANVLAGA
jgi:hypothetical protein